MEWNILVVGGTVLIVFVGLIIKPILSLNKILIMLDNSICNLGNAFADMKDDNEKSHERIFNQLTDHESRIGKIEKH